MLHLYSLPPLKGFVVFHGKHEVRQSWTLKRSSGKRTYMAGWNIPIEILSSGSVFINIGKYFTGNYKVSSMGILTKTMSLDLFSWRFLTDSIPWDSSPFPNHHFGRIFFYFFPTTLSKSK